MMPMWKFILLIIVNLIPLALCVWGIVWFIKYLMRWREDGQRLRMEVGKLADEVQQIRKQMGNRQSEDSA
jgi:sensor domain CHASE-containing protein